MPNSNIVPFFVPSKCLQYDDLENLLQMQIMQNVTEWIENNKNKQTDQDKSLLSFILKVLLGGSNINWELKGSVEAVSDILNIAISTVYKYRNEVVEFVAKKRKRRSDALDNQNWWPEAIGILQQFWRQHSDESPIFNDVAYIHNYDSPANHEFHPVPGKPAQTHRVCIGTACQSHQKWNAEGCDSFMYRLFQEEHSAWTARITKDTLMSQKPFWITTPKNQ